MEGAIQAPTIAEDLKLPKVWFEGDSLHVVLSLQRMKDFCDWKASASIGKGRRHLKNHPFWSISHVNRLCNKPTHNLASWARTLKVTGSLDVTTIR